MKSENSKINIPAETLDDLRGRLEKASCGIYGRKTVIQTFDFDKDRKLKSVDSNRE